MQEMMILLCSCNHLLGTEQLDVHLGVLYPHKDVGNVEGL